MIEVRHSPKIELVDLHDNYYRVKSKACEDLPRLDYAFRSDLASVTEFIDVIFYVECSRVASHQLVRHRLCSIVQLSQRRGLQEPIVLLPRNVPIREVLPLLEEVYCRYLEYCKKVPPEHARYILSQCFLTSLYLKTNLRELAYIINVRACRRAQAETRYIAIRMGLLLVEKYPELRTILAPYCARYGHCKYSPEKRDPEKLRKCREAGYREAFQLHGTDSEIERLEEIVSQLL